MLQQSSGLSLDPIIIDREMWIGYKIYVCFLFAALAWAGFRIIRVWSPVPPFSSKARHPPDRDCVKSWRRLARSVARWTGLILVGAALIVAIALCRMASVPPQVALNASVFLPDLGDVGGSLVAALVVVLVLYLIRWHLMLRIER